MHRSIDKIDGGDHLSSRSNLKEKSVGIAISDVERRARHFFSSTLPNIKSSNFYTCPFVALSLNNHDFTTAKKIR